MVAADLRRMSAEAWATLIAGMMQALVTLIGLFLAYMLGKNQGKYQTQHAESVRAVIEVRRRAIDAEESLGTCKNIMSSELPLWSAEDKEQALQDFKDKAWELYTYYRATRPWMWKRTTKKIEPL